MKRTDFLKLLSFLPIAGIAMNLDKFKLLTDPPGNSERMPVLFVGHGSPMNALEQNEFTDKWKSVTGSLVHFLQR